MHDDEPEDAMEGVDDIKSGDEPGEPVHSPTIPEDEGNRATAPVRARPV